MAKFNYNRTPAWLAAGDAVPLRIVLLSQVIDRPRRSRWRALGRFARDCMTAGLAGAVCGALAGGLLVSCAPLMLTLCGMPV
jgi:hypothetical protein